MKVSAVLSALVVFSTRALASDEDLPAAHQERFLAQVGSLTDELAAWKSSSAGQYALQKGLYSEVGTTTTNGGLTGTGTGVLTSTRGLTTTQQLQRLYLTKLHILHARRTNPQATFSTDSPFTLMTNSEFRAYVNRAEVGVSGGFGTVEANSTTLSSDDFIPDTDRRLATTTIPTSKDWTTSSACVAPVKDQGLCGDCWAFSAVGALESAYCLKTGSLTLLSDQQVTSCDTVSSGCNGGWPLWGLNYLKTRGSVCTNASYPFTSGAAGVTGTCVADTCSSLPITMSVSTVSATDSALVTAIASRPVAVAVSAGNPQWKQYKTGVLSSCSTSSLDHAVLAVGYTSTYFRIKNQWGTAWGDNGFINLKRNGGRSACSVVNTHNVYPVLS